ncbi:MAG: DUF1102 domain-containing protein, partial [Halodesulfurarchaeum sp.]
GTDQLNDAIELQPSSGPNGDYAVINTRTGELELRFGSDNPYVPGAGLNPDTITPFNNVFTVTNNGSEPGRVWFTVRTSLITFYTGADRDESLVGRNNSVVLEPNETIHVGVLIDATDEDVESVEEFTVHAHPLDADSAGGTGGSGGDLTSADQSSSGPVVQVSSTDRTRSISITNAPAESFRIDFTPLLIDRRGGTLMLESITVTPTEPGDVSLRVSRVEPGARAGVADRVGVESLGAVTVTVEPGSRPISRAVLRFRADRSYLKTVGVSAEQLAVYRTDGGTNRSGIEIVDAGGKTVSFTTETAGFSTFTVAALVPEMEAVTASLNASTIEPGDVATVSATVENVGRYSGTGQVPVTVNGATVATRTVDLPVGGQSEILVPLSPREPGTYTVEVDGTRAGTLTVVRPSMNETTSRPAGSPGPGGTGGDGGISESTSTPTSPGGRTTQPPEGVSGRRIVKPTQSPVSELSGFGLSPMLILAGVIMIAASLLFLHRTDTE